MARTPSKTLDQVEQELSTFSDGEPSQNKRDAPKEFYIGREDGGLYFIAYTAGGEVPDALKSMFTSVRVAQAALDDYVARQAVKEEAK